MSSAWSGLKGFTANLANDIGGFFGYGQDSVSPSSAGFNNVSAMNHHINKEHDKGKSLANRDQIGKVVSSIHPATKAIVDAVTFAGYLTLSPEGQRAYSYADDKGLNKTQKGALGLAGGYLGLPGQLTNIATETVSLGLMQDDGTNTGRRNTAQQSFTGNTGRVGGNGQLTNPTNAVAAAPSRPSFNAPSYGFGDYNSHLEGLLS